MAEHNEKNLDPKRIFLVGSPNVGKSATFNALTGSYVVVSNYPGTTVDITTGKMKVGKHHQLTIVDTPGMYSLKPITAEEDVTRQLIISEKPDCILHVVDAKNLERMLPLTLQLIDTGLPIILVLNIYDELLERGMQFDIAHLEHDLGIPVVKTVSVRGTGIDNLTSRIVEVIEDRYRFNTVERSFSVEMEEWLSTVASLLENDYFLSKRSIASLILMYDKVSMGMIENEKNYEKIKNILSDLPQDVPFQLSRERQGLAMEIVEEHLERDEKKRKSTWKESLSQLMIHPIWGIPILIVVLWFGLYKFVGQFGAGFLVDFIESSIFEVYVTPHVDTFFRAIFGNNLFFDLFAGEFGIVTLGVRYAVAIIFPIVATFFMAFSIIEDTGYLPRLAMLVDRVFKRIGLSGRAIIPLTLGFGCDTMATIVTRTLETKKERIIATVLLSLAIPCSAQLGVLLGLMSGNPRMLIIWAMTIILIFILSGLLAKALVKGDDIGFFMELPPLRLPSFMNVFIKTYTRMIWYFKEVIPLFIFASAAIWIGKITGLFEVLLKLISYPVMWTGMPVGASPAFLYGFFRRDFGAAGLFDLVRDGTLSGNGLLVATVVLTLFVPCSLQ